MIDFSSLIKNLSDEQLDEMQQCISAELERRSLDKLEELRSLPDQIAAERDQTLKTEVAKADELEKVDTSIRSLFERQEYQRKVNRDLVYRGQTKAAKPKPEII